MKSVILPSVLVFGLSLGLAGAAYAHVGVSPAAAPANSIVEANFMLAHGCTKTTTTTAITIEAAGEQKLVHPMDAKGWKLDTIKKNGKTVGATWTAKDGAALPPAFMMHVEMPAKAGPLYFDVTQTCGSTSVKWNERPAGDGKLVEHPAPMIDVGGKAPAKPAEHHH